MAEEVILSAIKEIEILLLHNAETINGYAKEFMEEIQNDLILILDFLEDSAPGSNKLLNYLIADIVEISHDVQDYIRAMGPNLLSSPQTGLIQHRLKKLKPMILHFGDEEVSAPSPLRSSNVGDQENRHVVGLEKTIESLLREHVLQSEEIFTGYYTCVIEGVGGIGKTTLARELYNHAAVAAHFQHRAWVCVSCLMSNKHVLMELIMQVVEGVGFELLEKMDNGSLQQMLHQHLQNKPYFIVLDDVDEDAYVVSVLKALPLDEGSRLLLTSQGLGQMLMHCNYIHIMEFLDDDKSWQLFLKTVFHGNTNERSFPKQLEKRARKMLQQCSGLPLAIIEVGRQLASKRRSGSEWDELLESPVDLTQTLASLESSYCKLPTNAKSIFLCLCFFQEGTTVRVEKLLQIAIEAGVVVLQEEGEYALVMLKLDSFVEIKNITKGGRPKELHIRTVFHRLSVKEAEEEIGFEIVRNNGISRFSMKPLHRAIYCSREQFNDSMNQDEHLVSLFFRGGGNFDASPSYWERFERLVVLDMEGFGLKMVPETIGMLSRLRYLGLRNNYIQKLPLSLSRLKKLEVLDIALNFMVEVPDIIWEMGSLCHVYMSNITCSRPLKIDALENLETLTYISIDYRTYELSGLQKMTRLCKLGIEDVDGESNVSKLFTCLAELENLSSLILKGFRFKSMPLLDEIGVLHRLTTLTLKLDGLLTRLPSAKNFPPNIEYLTLVNSSLDDDPMPVLEKLPLRVLKLQNAYTGQQMVISNGGFWDLESFCIKELLHLRNIRVGEYAMSNLERLEISGCPYLQTLPEVKSHFEGFKIVTKPEQ